MQPKVGMDDLTGSVLVEDSEILGTGTTVRGRYRIIAELGVGGFGTVCSAEDEATGHRVAIRLLRHDLSDAFRVAYAGDRGRSIAAASTSHHGLVQVREFGETESGQPFVVMELVEGRRLSDILSAREPLDAERALGLALAFGGALETLHKVGLLHGALRARNVVLLADGRVKLTDLELASLRGALTEEADVRAFVVLLHEMLRAAPRESRRALPPTIEAVVTRAFAGRSTMRLSMQDLLNLLWGEAHRPARRARRPIVVLLSMVVAVASGLSTPHPTAPPRSEDVARPAALVPADAPAARDAFWVQVGAFRNPDAARRVAARLRARAYPVAESSTAPGEDVGELHRVRVGPYVDRATATVTLRALRQAGYRAFVVRTRS